MNDLKIAKAYAYHTGTFKFSKAGFSGFLQAFPELLEEQSRTNLESIIKNDLPRVRAELDIKVDSNKLGEVISTFNNEIHTFLKQAHEVPISEVSFKLSNTSFARTGSKNIITTALRTVYADAMADFGNDALGPVHPSKTEDTVSRDSLDSLENTEDPMAEPSTPKPEADELTSPTEVSSRIDAKVEEDAVFTVEGYLQREVFKNRLIPEVSITEARPLKNGYVVDLQFSSKDGKVTAFAAAAIHNGKLVLPAELEDQDGNVLGDFNQETFMRIFSIQENQSPASKDSYDGMMADLMSADTEFAKAAALESLTLKFGPDIARGAWESVELLRKTGTLDSSMPMITRLEIAAGLKQEEYDYADEEDYVSKKEEEDEDDFIEKITKKYKGKEA